MCVVGFTNNAIYGQQTAALMLHNGSYKGVIKREAGYKGTNKDYLPKAKPRGNDHFTWEAKPSKGKMHCPRA